MEAEILSQFLPQYLLNHFTLIDFKVLGDLTTKKD